MEQLARTERRIASLRELLNAVVAIRSLSALRLQEGRQALDGVRQYAITVDRALAAAVPLLPPAEMPPLPAEGSAATIVFGSEHGFVGSLNGRLLEVAVGHVQGHRNSRLLMVGSRSARIALDAGAAVAWTQAMATRSDGVIEVARNAADEIYRAIAANQFDKVVMVYAKTEAAAQWTIQSRDLLPFDPTPYRRRDRPAMAPGHYLPPERLIEKLVEELIFAELMRAAFESFASEHAARLAAMESAHHSIEEKLQLLTRDAHIQRQEEVTTELLDVVAGAEAFSETL
jgi:F-type H+-transporting ATPase subunit gamma